MVSGMQNDERLVIGEDALQGLPMRGMMLLAHHKEAVDCSTPELCLLGDFPDICTNNQRVFESTLAHFTPKIIHGYTILHNLHMKKQRKLRGIHGNFEQLLIFFIDKKPEVILKAKDGCLSVYIIC